MPKLNSEKHEICLVPKMLCVSYTEQQLFQVSNVTRSPLTNMNYFEYQYGQASNMPKFNHEKHQVCLVPKMPCISYNEQQLFQVSNVPRSLMTKSLLLKPI